MILSLSGESLAQALNLARQLGTGSARLPRQRVLPSRKQLLLVNPGCWEGQPDLLKVTDVRLALGCLSRQRGRTRTGRPSRLIAMLRMSALFPLLTELADGR